MAISWDNFESEVASAKKRKPAPGWDEFDDVVAASRAASDLAKRRWGKPALAPTDITARIGVSPALPLPASVTSQEEMAWSPDITGRVSQPVIPPSTPVTPSTATERAVEYWQPQPDDSFMGKLGKGTMQLGAGLADIGAKIGGIGAANVREVVNRATGDEAGAAEALKTSKELEFKLVKALEGGAAYPLELTLAEVGFLERQMGQPGIEQMFLDNWLIPKPLEGMIEENPAAVVATLAPAAIPFVRAAAKRGVTLGDAVADIGGAAREAGFSVGPLPKEPGGRAIGSPLAGAQDVMFPEGPVAPTKTPTWSNTMVALEKLPEQIKVDSLINWLSKDGPRIGVGIPKAELTALQLDKFMEQNRGKTVSKAEVRAWVADRVVRVEERVLGGDVQREAIRMANDNGESLFDVDAGARAAYMEQARRLLGEEGIDTTKFDRPDLRLPGGENYREVLVKAPLREGVTRATQIRERLRIIREGEMPQAQEQLRQAYTNNPDLQSPEAMAAVTRISDLNREKSTLLAEYDTIDIQRTLAPDFPGGHFDPNTLAHMRLTDRTVKAGGRDLKTLFSEEFQSDWNNAFRKGEAPEHPLLGEWKEVLFKRFVRKAAEEGKEAVAWTTGEQQKARYDLSKTVDTLRLKRTASDEAYSISGQKGGTSVFSKRFDSLDELPGIIGKEPAEKLSKAIDDAEVSGSADFYNGVSIEGVDLQVGGKWTENLYDRDMVNIANKWARRFGGKVERGEALGPPVDTLGGKIGREALEVHTLPLTAEMRSALIYEGQPTFGTPTSPITGAAKLARGLEDKGYVLGSDFGNIQKLLDKQRRKSVPVSTVEGDVLARSVQAADDPRALEMGERARIEGMNADQLRNEMRSVGLDPSLYDDLIIKQTENARRHGGPLLDAPHRAWGSDNTLITRERAQVAIDSLNDKLKNRGGAGIPVDAIPKFIELAVYHAEALMRQAGAKAVDYSVWAVRMLEQAKKFGYELTEAELNRIWDSPKVKMVREGLAQADPGTLKRNFETQPRGRGRLAAFEREAAVIDPRTKEAVNAPARGRKGFHTERRALDEAALVERVVSQDIKKRFGTGWFNKIMGRGLSEADRAAFAEVAQGVGRDSKGELTYGGTLRAGTIRVPKNEPLPEMGTKYIEPNGQWNGRVVSAPLNDAKGRPTREVQLVRAIMPDEAKAAYENLRANHPKAAILFDQFNAFAEPPTTTYAGIVVPPTSRHVLKRLYDVVGLTAEEAAMHATALETALGKGVVPAQMNWIPEHVITRPHTVEGFGRNLLRRVSAPVRRFKAGSSSELVRAGEAKYDIVEGLRRARIGLAKEAIHNKMAADLVSTFAVEADPAVIKSNPGKWVKLDEAIFGTSERFLGFAQRNMPLFAEAGIDVRGGTHMIPRWLKNELAPAFEPKTVSMNNRYQKMVDAVDTVGATIVNTMTEMFLTGPASGAKNLLSGVVTQSIKPVRDFYSGVYRQMIREGDLRTNFQPLLSDLDPRVWGKAAADTALETFHGDPKWTPPAELLGSTFYREMIGTGVSTPIGKTLRYTFQPPDIFLKKLLYEQVTDAAAQTAWSVAKREGKTGNLPKSQFIAEWKSNVPPEIRDLAWLEQDTFGAYDYSNVNAKLRALKQAKLGRAALPFPTYTYKWLNNTLGELFGPHNLRNLVSKHSDERVKALANISTGATLMAAAYWAIQALKEKELDQPLPKGVKERDLPIDVQKTGRIPINGWWARFADIPFIGEMLLADDLSNGNLTAEDIPAIVNERLGVGPLVTSAAALYGLSTEYNKNQSFGTKLGYETAKYLPFRKELGLIRRYIDPLRRDIEKSTNDEWDNFTAALKDSIPWLSTQLPEKVNRRTSSFMPYAEGQALLGYFLMNARQIDPDEREWAIGAAGVRRWQLMKRDRDEDTLRSYIRMMYDARQRISLEGRMKMSAKADPIEFEKEVQAIRWSILVEDAYWKGGLDPARTELQRLINESQAGLVQLEGIKSGIDTIKRLKRLEATGYTYSTFKNLPPEQQQQWADEMMQQLEEVRRRMGEGGMQPPAPIEGVSRPLEEQPQ